MNKQDRKTLSETLEAITANVAMIREMADSEQEKFDDMPEGLQQGERGEALEQAADALAQGADEMESATEELQMLAEA